MKQPEPLCTCVVQLQPHDRMEGVCYGPADADLTSPVPPDSQGLCPPERGCESCDQVRACPECFAEAQDRGQ